MRFYPPPPPRTASQEKVNVEESNENTSGDEVQAQGETVQETTAVQDVSTDADTTYHEASESMNKSVLTETSQETPGITSESIATGQFEEHELPETTDEEVVVDSEDEEIYVEDDDVVEEVVDDEEYDEEEIVDGEYEEEVVLEGDEEILEDVPEDEAEIEVPEAEEEVEVIPASPDDIVGPSNHYRPLDIPEENKDENQEEGQESVKSAGEGDGDPSFGEPVTSDDGGFEDAPQYEEDIETGSGVEETKEIFNDEGESNEQAHESEEKAKDVDGNKLQRQIRCLLLVLVLLCCALIAVAIALPLTLIDDDDSTAKGGIQTTAPSAAPPADLGYVNVGDDTWPEGFQFGVSAAASQAFLAVGITGTDSGAVVMYEPNPDGGNPAYTRHSIIEGVEEGSSFGLTVDLALGSTPGLLVGAPTANGRDTLIATGAAFYYQLAKNGIEWELLGSQISGDNAPRNANEMFGAAVATSDILRIAIGAPMYNEAPELLKVGQVYTYDYVNTGNGFDWVQSSKISENVADALYGSSVAISKDGSTLAAGAPGIGAFKVLKWQTADWVEVFTDKPNGGIGDGFGEELAMVDDMFIAVGAPDANGGAGVVRIYEKTSDSEYTVAAEIKGAVGERVGAPGTLKMAKTSMGTSLFIGTANGLVLRYDQDSDGNWDTTFNVLDSGFTAGLSAIGAGAGDVVIATSVGESKVSFFDLSTVDSNDSITRTPATAAPTSSPSWNLIGSEGSIANVGDISALSISGNVLAVGVPTFDGGVVQTYSTPDLTGISAVANPDGTGGLFGTAVDISSRGMVVGAPKVKGQTFAMLNFGAAFFLQRTGSTWVKLGNTILNEEDITTADGEFGASVAVADDVDRVVIGSPRITASGLVRVGAGFIYEFDGTNWSQMASVAGFIEEGNLGTSVDISKDGNVVIVGGPNAGGGYINVVRYTGSEWIDADTKGGASSTEDFGMDVAFLTRNGDTYAVASSLSVRVYKLEGDTYTKQGQDIIGSTYASVDGADGELVVGTTDGKVFRYTFDGSSWTVVSDSVLVGNTVNHVATTGDASLIAAVKDGGVIDLYELA